MTNSEPGLNDTPPALFTAEIRQVVQPVGDVGQAIEFYSAAFGFDVRFVDGTRFAALNGGGVALAVVTPEEDVALTSAPSIKVSDLDAFLERFAAIDGIVLQAPETGPHERRTLISDPWGNRVIVYSPL